MDSGLADKGKPKANLTSELGGGGGEGKFQFYLSIHAIIIESYHFSSVKYHKTASPWNEQYYCTLICQKSRTMAALSGL